MKCGIGVLALVDTLAAMPQSPGAATHMLDLLTYRFTPPPQESPASGSISQTSVTLPAMGMSSHGGPVSPASLRVTLLSLDRLTYQLLDPVIYEVWLENIGNAPVILPWSPDLELFVERPARNTVVMTYTRSLSLRLAVSGPRGILGTAGLVALHASAAVDGSFITLLPKETAWIRASSTWFDDWTDREQLEQVMASNGVVQVRAAFDIWSPRSEHTRSANGMEITLQPRRGVQYGPGRLSSER